LFVVNSGKDRAITHRNRKLIRMLIVIIRDDIRVKLIEINSDTSLKYIHENIITELKTKIDKPLSMVINTRFRPLTCTSVLVKFDESTGFLLSMFWIKKL
jgi:hypothetical protein